ncbi:MAG: hypothetical protein A3F12_08005 [Gammaproteobacteria bacterium RIFCSPHIGHO2_12_FULL_38_14]|nr:MAG: hypothetical protein A3F12_08005 [Gammaproteobacteria bacterium RIFCSPHIGHO2_12_FULL_38_14]
MKKIIPIFGAVVLFYSFSLFAAKVPDLYQVELPVTAQSDTARNTAMQKGLMQVLVKLTGEPTIVENDVIKGSLDKADTYVQEFSYLPSSRTDMPYTIQIRYNSGDIQRLLKRAGVAYWNVDRPLILMYLTWTTKDHQTEIIGHDVPQYLLDMTEQQGKIYGLPIIFPMMDMTDTSQIAVQDILNMNIPSLKQASKRYEPDALLVGHMEEVTGGVTSVWRLTSGNNQWDFVINELNSKDVIASLMSQVSQTLAKRYVVKTTNATSTWLKLTITNVTGSNDLPQLMQYLQQMPDIMDVRLQRIIGDVVEVKILVKGSLETFKQNAAVGERLVAQTEDEGSRQLVYEWTP